MDQSDYTSQVWRRPKAANDMIACTACNTVASWRVHIDSPTGGSEWKYACDAHALHLAAKYIDRRDDGRQVLWLWIEPTTHPELRPNTQTR